MSYSPKNKPFLPRILVINDGNPVKKIEKRYGNRVVFARNREEIALPYLQLSSFEKTEPKIPWYFARKWDVCIVLNWDSGIILDQFINVFACYCPTTIIGIGGEALSHAFKRCIPYTPINPLSKAISLRMIDELISRSREARKCLIIGIEQFRSGTPPIQVLDNLKNNFSDSLPQTNRQAIIQEVGMRMLRLSLSTNKFKPKIGMVVTTLLSVDKEEILFPKGRIKKTFEKYSIEIPQGLDVLLKTSVLTYQQRYIT